VIEPRISQSGFSFQAPSVSYEDPNQRSACLVSRFDPQPDTATRSIGIVGSAAVFRSFEDPNQLVPAVQHSLAVCLSDPTVGKR
jgi:hypothetical protein